MLTDRELDIMRTIPKDKLQSLPSEICALLIGKGLSFAQAQVLLSYSKDLLEEAKI